MLKYSETIINSSVRKQDTTWDYSWMYNSSNTDNNTLSTDLNTGETLGTDTWIFCGDANESRQYDENTWDSNHPIFEYNGGEDGIGPDSETETWNNSHPYNPTRYLSPGDNKFIRITNTTQNVTIDPIPPAFVSDYGTEYLALETVCDGKIVKKDNKLWQYSTETRKIALEFKDEIGLDFKQVALVIGDIDNENEIDENKIIYYYDRSIDKAIKKDYVESISFNGTNRGNYQVVFNLYECWGELDNNKEIKEIHYITDTYDDADPDNSGINGEKVPYTIKKDDKIITRYRYDESDISLIVWDLAGNYSVYHIKRGFNTLALDDLNDLVPVNILFTSIEPENYYIESGIEGKIITKVQNPNDVLWFYENIANLLESSIGTIDIASYEGDDNRQHNPLDGIREFIISNLTESGNVEVEAWVETGFPEIDELIKERTYNTAICGPWIYGDEGRKYHITPYVPKYLHGTEFADFMEFFQLYINTMYKGLDNNRNISGLEKIARIGNFNDIARLEDSLVYHYAKEFGNEFDFDVQSLQEVNLIQNGEGFTTRDTKETFEIIKYVLEQLPAYNRYKGTNTGIEMAIKMFGFSCRVINLWVRKEQEIEKNPEFIEEERLFSFDEYFMTSRFSLEMDARNNTFKTFCDNIDMFIDLIKSIKPITKILDQIKYTIINNVHTTLLYDTDVIEDENSDELKYTLKWTFNKNTYKDVFNIEKLCKLDYTTGTADLFCLNYKPSVVSAPTTLPTNSKFNVIAKFLKSNFDKITFTIKSPDEGTTTFDFFRYNNKGELAVKPILNAGSFFLYLIDPDNATKGFNIIRRYFKFDKLYDENSDYEVEVYMAFTIQPGTDYARADKAQLSNS